jgi:hypothetical protein
MTTRSLLLISGIALALGGCATLDQDIRSAGDRQVLHNEQGHVIGYKELLRNRKTGEVLAQVHQFAPIRNDAGDVIAYEETSRGGAIVRDLNGRAIGNRFIDLRSRDTNMRSRGVTIIIGSLDTRRVITNKDRPKLNDLMASLSASDLSAIR